LPPREPRIKLDRFPGVIAKLAPDRAGILAVSWPDTKACPHVGINNVARILRIVDFPAPFAPSSATASPSCTSNVTPLNAGRVAALKGLKETLAGHCVVAGKFL